MKVIGPLRREAGSPAPVKPDIGESLLRGFKAHTANATNVMSSMASRLKRPAAVDAADAAVAARAEPSFEKRKAQFAVKIGSVPEQKLDGLILGSDGYAYPVDKFRASEVPSFRPSDGRKPAKTSYYTNGIDAGSAGVAAEAQRVADATGAEVLPVYNARETKEKDIIQTFADRRNLGSNKAAETLASLAELDLRAGRQADLIGYSQGSAIVARASRMVEKRLTDDPTAVVGNSRAPQCIPVEQALKRLKVTTLAGVADRFPKNIQLEAHVNTEDPIAGALGIKKSRSLLDVAKGAATSMFPPLRLVFGPASAPDDAMIKEFSEPAPGGDPHQLDTYLRQYERR